MTKLNRLLLLAIIILIIAFLTGCAIMPPPSSITDAIGITHVKENKENKEAYEERQKEKEQEAMCITKVNAWGDVSQNSRNNLWRKLVIKKVKLNRDVVTFYSLPYFTFICPTKEQLIGFEQMLSSTGGLYTLVYDGTMTTKSIQGTQCKRLYIAYTAVGLKLDEFNQGDGKEIHIIWDIEELPDFPLQEGWVSTSLNRWIIDYKESTSIMKERQKQYRQRKGLPDKPTKEYQHISCVGSLHYQDRRHLG